MRNTAKYIEQQNDLQIKQYKKTFENNPLYYYINILAYMGAKDFDHNDIPETYSGFVQAIAIRNTNDQFEILTHPKTWYPTFNGFLVSPFADEFRNGYYCCPVFTDKNIGKFFPTKGMLKILDQNVYFKLTH